MLAGKESDRTKMMTTIRNLEISMIAMNKDLDHLSLTASDKDKQVRLYTLDLKETTLEQERLIARKGELESEILNWQELNQSVNSKISEIQTQIECETATFASKQAELETGRLDYVKVEQEFRTLNADVERLHCDKSDLF